MFCPNCGKEISDLASVCVNCGVAVKSNNQIATTANDKKSIGLCIVSFLIPIFGFIYWAVNANTTPKKAKACGISAIISVVAAVVFYVLIYVIIFAAAMADSGYYY